MLSPQVAVLESDGAEEDQDGGDGQRQHPGPPGQAVLERVAGQEPVPGLAARIGRRAGTCRARPWTTKPATAAAEAVATATGRLPVAAPTAKATAA
jgi:hypothetical protein